MRYLLLLAAASVALATKPEKEVHVEPKPEESALPIRVYNEEHHENEYEDGLELVRKRAEQQRMHIIEQREGVRKEKRDGPISYGYRYKDDLIGPPIFRTPDPLPSSGHPNIERQNKIVEYVYSPDYVQPTWILDYRYLKSGGREYTRGPGGQILILPKGVKGDGDGKGHSDFDSLLEHLRLSRLSEYSDHRGHGDDHDASPWKPSSH